jgi:uncharacterized protein (TIGR03000 family)
MTRRLSVVLGVAVLATMRMPTTSAQAHHGPGGAHYGGFYYGHPYPARGFNGFPVNYGYGLYAPYGYYRPYYGYGLGGLGLGGLGLGLGGYGLGGYGLGGIGYYRPYYGGTTVVAPVVVNPSPAAPAAGALTGETPPPPLAPPPDDAAHLQLVVPENAEVLFDGGKTDKTGPVREFVSPKLTPGKLFNYTITVRYTDAGGQPITDKRIIEVRANDWFRIDFTRPAPPEPPAP